MSIFHEHRLRFVRVNVNLLYTYFYLTHHKFLLTLLIQIKVFTNCIEFFATSFVFLPFLLLNGHKFKDCIIIGSNSQETFILIRPLDQHTHTCFFLFLLSVLLLFLFRVWLAQILYFCRYVWHVNRFINCMSLVAMSILTK